MCEIRVAHRKLSHQSFVWRRWCVLDRYDLNNNSVVFKVANSSVKNAAGQTAIILSTAGVLSVNAPLNYFVDPLSYWLLVNMTDNGKPPMSTLVTVNVSLQGSFSSPLP